MRLVSAKPRQPPGIPDGLIGTAKHEALGRRVYELMYSSPKSGEAQRLSRLLLSRSLMNLKPPTEFPDDVTQLEKWSEYSAMQVTVDYQNYLRKRKAGERRAFFKTRGSALSFLAKVAPTKLVDGAWLYGVMVHWDDVRYRTLIKTYLEELGDGDPRLNHVFLYQKLLASMGMETPCTLADRYYLQGSLQLALGYHSDEFFPELLGYNLGYEQLPLHLLISAYELAELDIDPYYFTLHVTIDNASTGHARQAVQAVLEHLPTNGKNASGFWGRVMRGYALNGLGVGTMDAIHSFNHYQEVVHILTQKSRFGQLHSDYRKIKGATVNEWLSRPDAMPDFLEALVADGWIKMGKNPDDSPFWQLLKGPKGCMFGVFSRYERTIISEWIAGSSLGEPENEPEVTIDAAHTGGSENIRPVEVGNGSRWSAMASRSRRDIPPDTLAALIELMAPGIHHTPEGLEATRIFSDLLKIR